MSTKFLRRGLLLAMFVPALLTAGCAASGSGQAMKGAASPAPPTATDTGMGDSPMPGDSASPTDSEAAKGSPRSVVEKFYEALSSGEGEKAAKMFTSDGVAAVQGKETAEGTQALTEVFEDERTEGSPTIDESEVMGQQAFVRANVGEGEDASRGFFLLTKEGNSWKIDRFMSNSTS
jgi:ketosteroid isomerase-like protein